MDWPPPGINFKLVITKRDAATSSAIPIPIWTRRRDQPATMPAPNHAPRIAAPIKDTSVNISTCTMAMNRKASRMVGGVWPTFRVPGIFSSGTSRKNLKMAVVGANDPIPRVSKKLVMQPMASSAREGTPGARPLPVNQIQA